MAPGRLQKYPFVSKNSVERFVKQREIVFDVGMYQFINVSIRLSLGLNSFVHRSAVSAPKAEMSMVIFGQN